MGIFRGGFSGGDFPGEGLMGGNFLGGNFPGGNFPKTSNITIIKYVGVWKIEYLKNVA